MRATLLRLVRVLACLTFLAAHHAAWSDTFPSRPVRIVVPFAPGGTSDVVTRTIGKELSTQWKVPVIVDNRPGAGGNIGSDEVARAPADGYTLLMGTVATHGINKTLYTKLPFDPVKDFAPVSLVATTPSIVLVNATFPANTVEELIAQAKAKPGTLHYGSAGNGSSHHLAGQMLASQAGVNIVHVPYKGTGNALTDLLGGQIQIVIDTFPSAIPHVRAGKLKALAVTSTRRYPTLPQVPSLSESLKGYEVGSWYGLLAPASTPAAVVKKLGEDVASIVNQAEVKERLIGLGANPVGSSPAQFAAHIDAELKKWGAVVKASGATVD